MKKNIEVNFSVVNNWLVIGIVAVLLVFGAWGILKSADKDLRNDLLQQTLKVEQATNLFTVKYVSGTNSDVDPSQLRLLKDQLEVIFETTVNTRYLYLLGQKQNDSVFFFLDIGEGNVAEQGETYKDASKELISLFKTGRPFVEGPLTDKWGTWISALVPVVEKSSGKIVAVLGIDIDSSAWRWGILTRVGLPLAFLLFVLFVFVFIAILVRLRTSRQIQKSITRLQRAEIASKSVNWQLDFDTEIMNISFGVKNLLGIASDQINLADFKKLVLPEYIPQLETALREVKEEKKNCNLEFKIRTKDTNDLKFIHSNAYPDPVENTSVGIFQDFTELRKVETELHEREEQFRNIFENILIGIYRTSPDGRILMANPATIRMLGFDSFDELSGRNLEKEGFDSKHSRNKFLNLFEATDEISGIESVWLRKDGSPLFVRESALAHRDDTGEIKYFEGTIEDITGQKLIEENLKKSRQINKAMIDANPDILFQVDKNGVILDYHASNDNQLYVPPELFIGKEITEVLPHDVAVPILTTIEVALETDQLSSMEYELTKDEITRSFENRIIPIGNDEVLSFVRDITDNKLAEAALRKSEETFRILNVLSAQMLIQPDLESLYKYIANSLFERFENTLVFYNSIANEKDESKLEAIIGIENSLVNKFIGMLGYNPVGKKFKMLPDYYEIIKPGRLVEFTKGLGEFAGGVLPDFLARTIEKMVGIHKIYTIGIWKDQRLLGAIHFMTFNKKSINDASFIETFANQAGIVIQKKIAEQKLIESEGRLKELNVTKDKFFSIIAHDLKSPFNSILGFSELLIRQIQEGDYEGIEKYAGIIEGSSEHAMNLLTNLLEWSRSQTSRMEFNPEYVEMVSLIREVSVLFDDTARQKKIVITKELPRSVIVHADKSMISTVLRNLLSNAVKFTGKKGKITISAIEEDTEWKFLVSDSGVGIRGDLVEKIFRIDSNHTTLGTNNEKGTGLGLILCEEFVEKHRGKIWVESEVGQGSKFYFTIPKR